MNAFTVRKRLGRCYELAGRALVLDDLFPEGALLVHGMVTSPVAGTPLTTIDHAWVESDDRVWDPTLNSFYAKEHYYTKFDAVALDRYTKVEAARKIGTIGHWGHWGDDARERA